MITLVSDTAGHNKWAPASVRGRLERLLGGRVVGLRVEKNGRARITPTVSPGVVDSR